MSYPLDTARDRHFGHVANRRCRIRRGSFQTHTGRQLRRARLRRKMRARKARGWTGPSAPGNLYAPFNKMFLVSRCFGGG